MKTNSTAISALVALALTGCNIDSRTKVIRPADRPVAEVSAIAAMKGEQLTEKCSFEKDGYTFAVQSMRGRRVSMLRVTAPEVVPEPEVEPGPTLGLHLNGMSRLTDL